MSPAPKKYAILLVDDEQDILDMLETFLTGMSCEILTARTSAHAIEILQKKEIAVLICDLHMADDLDGNDILSVARSANADIVSILMSGSMDRSDMITALNTGGVSRYLEKPLHVDEVVAMVEEGLARYARQSRPQERLKALAKQQTVLLRDDDNVLPKPTKKISIVRRESQRICDNEGIGNRYQLLSILGEGRVGVVYEAKDLFLHSTVALKVLNPKLTASEREIAVLKEEARIAMTLTHKHIVRLYNFDKVDANYFLVMEYVPGCSVRDVLVQDGPFPEDSVKLIVHACASAVSYAHEHSVVHQDLKPDNMLISDEGLIKIIDFGLACLTGDKGRYGHISGTPFYMSPEQKKGEPVDSRTDIYSLGIITYELLRGRPPFPAETGPEDALKMDPGELTGLAEPVARVVQKAIARDPDDRWSSVTDFADALIEAMQQNE